MFKLLPRYATAAVLMLAIASPSFAKPTEKKAEFDASNNGFNIAQLLETGEPFFRSFFGRGWPTNRQTKSVTVYDASGSSFDALKAIITSEAGIKLSNSAYIEAVRGAGLRKGGNPWSKGSDVVTTKLEEFAIIANYNGDKRFEPVLFEFGQATPKYNGPYNASNLRSHAWVTSGSTKNQVSMEAVASLFYAEAAFARQQLLEETHTAEDGLRTVQNFGSSPEHAFFALVCLQNALAKVHELKARCIHYKDKTGEFKKWDAYDLKGTNAWFPHRLTVKNSTKGLAYTVDKKNDNSLQSDLYEQAMILRGCNELFQIVKYGAKGATIKGKNTRPLKALFARRTFPGMEDFPFMPDAMDTVADVALLVVTNMQRMHFDVSRRTMRSRSSDNPELQRVQLLTSRDIGVTLSALSGFLAQVDDLINVFSRSQTTFKDRLIRKRRYATTCLKLLTIWLLTKIRIRHGLFDRYNIAINRELDKQTSAISMGTVIQGLLDVSDLTASDLKSDTRETALKFAQDLMYSCERSLWNTDHSLYIGRATKLKPGKALDIDVSGQIAMLGALKEMAVRQSDVRFLIRYTKLMESLKKHGFVRSESTAGNEKGGDSDKDGIESPDKAGMAPVYRKIVSLKSELKK